MKLYSSSFGGAGSTVVESDLSKIAMYLYSAFFFLVLTIPSCSHMSSQKTTKNLCWVISVFQSVSSTST